MGLPTEQSPYRSMLVERSMLTMRIERSICPLTMLVERSAGESRRPAQKKAADAIAIVYDYYR